MESKKISELEQYNGSADGFMIPGVADGETQKANLGTLVEQKAEAAGFLKPDGLKTINGESVAGSGDLNVAVMNPLKGTYLDTDTLPTEGQAGDYIYVVNTNVTPRTANVYAWNGTAFADTGKSVEDFGLQFATGQAVNATMITPNIVTDDETDKIADARQINNLIDRTEVTSKNLLYQGEWKEHYYYKSDSALMYHSLNSEYKAMKCPCEPNTQYCLSVKSGVIAYSETHLLLIDEDETTYTDLGNNSRTLFSFTTGATTKYIGITALIDNESQELQLELGSVRTTYEEPFEPHSAITIKEDILPERTLQDGEVTSIKIADGAITNTKIANEAVTVSKLGSDVVDTVSSKNLVDWNNIAWYSGKYYRITDGYIGGGWSSGKRAQLIPVLPNTDYHLSQVNDEAVGNPSVGIVFYKEGVQNLTINDLTDYYINGVSATTKQFTTPANCYWLGVSVLNTATDLMLNFGTERGEYEPYGTAHKYIKIPSAPNTVDTSAIKDGAITPEKLDENIILPSSPTKYDAFRDTATLSAGDYLQLPLCHVTKNTSFVALIIGPITDYVEIGIGRGGSYEGCIRLTSTTVQKYYNGSAVGNVINLENSLGEYTKVICRKDIAAQLSVEIIHDYGVKDSAITTINNWETYVGRPFIRVGSSQATSITASLSFIPRDINKKVWIFGDSYMGLYSNSRMAYHFIDLGYTSWLLNAMPGISSHGSNDDLVNLLSTGAKPSYVVWALGMNSGNDASDGPNATWLTSVQQVITLCKLKGIEPILVTIPSVSNEGNPKIHAKMNQWIRESSNCRYIDVATAVEDSENPTDYHWRGWGTQNQLLSSDEEHPSTKGALEIAARWLLDFPEMMVDE